MLITNKKLRAFTLLELIVVIAIIAILAVIAVPSFTKSIKAARINAIKADITNLRKAIDNYYYNNGGKYSTIPYVDGGWNNFDGRCDDLSQNSRLKDTVFADPEVSKIIKSLKGKLYPGGNWTSNYVTVGFGNIFYCGVGNSNRDIFGNNGVFQNYVIVLWNIDNSGLGVCMDTNGFYNGKDYSQISSGSDFSGWPGICYDYATSGPFTFP